MTLLDANVVIHYVKGDPGVRDRMQTAEPGTLFVPTIVLYELRFGFLSRNERWRRALSAALAPLGVVSFDESAAEHAATVRFNLERSGKVIGPMDLLIAGTALSLNALLVTNNTREFKRVKGLRFEDWSTK